MALAMASDESMTKFCNLMIKPRLNKRNALSRKGPEPNRKNMEKV